MRLAFVKWVTLIELIMVSFFAKRLLKQDVARPRCFNFPFNRKRHKSKWTKNIISSSIYKKKTFFCLL
jgi:hypothetical protein